MSKFKNTFRIESARLKDWDYSTPRSYFVTINTYEHFLYFGKILNGKIVLNNLGRIAETELLNIESIRNNVVIDQYVIMPNHIHAIIRIIEHDVKTHCVRLPRPNEDNTPVEQPAIRNNLGNIIKGFKSAVTKSARENGYRNFAWQTRFYDRIIRDEKELYWIRNYIELNPSKWENVYNNLQL